MDAWTNQMTYSELRLLRDNLGLSLHRINYVLETSKLQVHNAEVLRDTIALLDKMLTQIELIMKG
jgi:hypothetical protein